MLKRKLPARLYTVFLFQFFYWNRLSRTEHRIKPEYGKNLCIQFPEFPDRLAASCIHQHTWPGTAPVYQGEDAAAYR